MNDTGPAHTWRFFRIGGFDQVRIDSAADILNLRQLDPKLWVALSCPVKGIEFDARTLALLDTDNDGHLRVPEVLAAIDWLRKVLKKHDALARADGVVALADINDATDEGRALLASARQILRSLGKADATTISAADTKDTAAIYACMRFNGDGFITASIADEDAATVDAIISAFGSEMDRSGKPGVDEARIVKFFEDATALLAWHARSTSDAAISTLGEDTTTAGEAFRKVRAKVDDFFTRTRLAAFDEKSAALLNPADGSYSSINPATLAANRDEIAALPLAAITADASLPLLKGLNPAWEEAVAALREKVVAKILGERDSLSRIEWEKICATLDAHEAWQNAKPVTPLTTFDIDALRVLADNARRERLLALVASDKAAAPEADGIAAVDKLLRFCRDMMQLANNFVSFREFYMGRKAFFQAGTLFLDGRSCELAVKVIDPGKHATLATLAGVYLVYCDCTRGADKIQIAAAFTDGDADQLMVGRNGVFWDRQGNDWYATITRIVEHPISIRQAFWTPYRRLARFIGEQLNKFAASKTAAIDKQLATGVEAKAAQISAPPPATPAAAPAPFDIARFAGIFAALGLALGAIGTALAALIAGFLALKYWQMPLAIAGAMLLVSGPAMLMAFLKLRKRNLGPILDANGWAVNARARINIPFGTSLTNLAELPDCAERSLIDPYAEKRSPWPWIIATVAIVFSAIWLWLKLKS